MKLQEKQKKQAGITLVALVVTIIILIILATISIQMVIGEGGLIWQANNGKVEYRAAEVEEEVLVWKTEKKLAKYANEIKPKERDDFIDDQLERGLLTPEEAEDAKKDGQVQIGSKVIDYGEDDTPTDLPEVPGSIKVKLKVDEANVTGTKIPVSVAEITTEENEEKTNGENLTYEWYIDDEESEDVGSTSSCTFSDLDESKTYKIQCLVTDTVTGESGTGEVTVLSFQVVDSLYRGTQGMTWNEWINSDYKKTFPLNKDHYLKFLTECGRQPGDFLYDRMATTYGEVSMTLFFTYEYAVGHNGYFSHVCSANGEVDSSSSLVFYSNPEESALIPGNPTKYLRIFKDLREYYNSLRLPGYVFRYHRRMEW